MTTHVMLDLETLSTRCGAAIIQIAAIAFDPLTGAAPQHPDTCRFNVFVADLAGRHVDAKTVAWWLQQKAAGVIGAAIQKQGVPLAQALGEFLGWYAALGEVEAVWSHGATFDIPILADAYADRGLAPPWCFRTPRDTRTLYALAPGGMPRVEVDPNRQHDALYDCEIQVKQVVGALAALQAATAPTDLRFAVGPG